MMVRIETRIVDFDITPAARRYIEALMAEAPETRVLPAIMWGRSLAAHFDRDHCVPIGFYGPDQEAEMRPHAQRIGGLDVVMFVRETDADHFDGRRLDLSPDGELTLRPA